MQGKRKAQRILIAEEDRVEAGILAFHLRRAGYKPLRVVDQQEVTDALEWGAPAAIIADLDSPGIDGLTLARTLQGSALTFVLVANRPLTAAEELEALRLRIPAILHKPIEPMELIERLQRSHAPALGPPDGTPEGHIRGDLSGRALADIIRLGARHHVDAYLSFNSEDEEGWLLMHRGQIIDAAIGELVARDAAVDLVIRDQGEFNLVPLDAKDPILNRHDSVRCDLISLLARATSSNPPKRGTGTPAGSGGFGLSMQSPLSRVTLPDALDPRPRSLVDGEAHQPERATSGQQPAPAGELKAPQHSRTRRRGVLGRPSPRPGAEPQVDSGASSPQDDSRQLDEVAEPAPTTIRTDELVNPVSGAEPPGKDEERAADALRKPDAEDPAAEGHEPTDISPDAAADTPEASEIRGRLVPRSFFSGGRRPTRRPTQPGMAAVGSSKKEETSTPPRSDEGQGESAAPTVGPQDAEASPSNARLEDEAIAGHAPESPESSSSPAISSEAPSGSVSEVPTMGTAAEASGQVADESPMDESSERPQITTAEWDTREYYFATDDANAAADDATEEGAAPAGQAFGGLTAPPPATTARTNNLRPVILILSFVLVASFLYVVVQLVTGRPATVPKPGGPSPSSATTRTTFEGQLGAAQQAFERKSFEESAKLFEAAANQNQDHPGARAGLAKSLFLAQRWPEARIAFDRLAQLTPKDPLVQWHLVHVLAATGDITRAERALQRFQQLAPSSQELPKLRQAIDRLK